eukprot:3178958-Rhodomonas_salina.2
MAVGRPDGLVWRVVRSTEELAGFQDAIQHVTTDIALLEAVDKEVSPRLLSEWRVPIAVPIVVSNVECTANAGSSVECPLSTVHCPLFTVVGVWSVTGAGGPQVRSCSLQQQEEQNANDAALDALDKKILVSLSPASITARLPLTRRYLAPSPC